MEKQAKETANERPKKHGGGIRPVVFNKEFSEWLRNSGTNPYTNTNNIGGGRSPRD